MLSWLYWLYWLYWPYWPYWLSCALYFPIDAMPALAAIRPIVADSGFPCPAIVTMLRLGCRLDVVSPGFVCDDAGHRQADR